MRYHLKVEVWLWRNSAGWVQGKTRHAATTDLVSGAIKEAAAKASSSGCIFIVAPCVKAPDGTWLDTGSQVLGIPGRQPQQIKTRPGTWREWMAENFGLGRKQT